MKTTIVDFATTEVVRGSFGYDSYLLYSALKSRGVDVKLIEDATPTQIHKTIGEKSDLWYIHYWSYPQKIMIDWANRNLRGEKKFIGYKPLIKKERFQLATEFDNNMLYEGMKNLPNILHEFKYGLMSDCDEHIRDDSMKKVMPLFLSYGCPRQCKFCPIPPNRRGNNPSRLELNIDDCKIVLRDMKKRGYTNIHFCDEDFFMNTNRAERLIETLSNIGGFKYIALASIDSLYRILERVKIQKLLESGLHVVELGLETIDINLRNKMKKTGTQNQLQRIINEPLLKDKTFFLSVSLFPGETIKSMSSTGEFLKRYGPNINKISNRIRANSTQGGLGQFFQPYEGCFGIEELDREGTILESTNPIRLTPSFVPYSLLREKPIQIEKIEEKDKFWFTEVYNLPLNKLEKTVIDGNKDVEQIMNKDINKLMYMMILTRLGKLTTK